MNITTHALARIGALSLLALPLAGGCASSNSKSGLASAEQLVERLEAAEAGAAIALSPESITADLAQAESDLDEHLSNKPDDVEALLLASRVGRLQQMTEPVALSHDQTELATDVRSEVLQAYLDHALTLQPDSAQAHYWKSRVFGARRPVVRDRTLSYFTNDLPSALQAARTAVNLEPNNVVYRENLANYLIANGSFDLAADLMAEWPGEEHPYCQILDAFDHLPLPEDAVYLADESQTFALRQMRKQNISDCPNARVRIYGVPMSPAQIESFYRGHWSNFTLFAQEQEGIFTQFLSGSMGGELTPARDQSRVPQLPTADHGILLNVVVLRNPPADKWMQVSFSGANQPGPVMCYICAVNVSPVN